MVISAAFLALKVCSARDNRVVESDGPKESITEEHGTLNDITAVASADNNDALTANGAGRFRD